MARPWRGGRGVLAGSARQLRVAYPFLADEAARLADLRKLGILDTAPEQSFDDLCQLASALCDVPIVQVNFIDAHRQWQKASLGLPRGEDPREASFCAHAIATPDRVMLVPDAREHPTLSSYPAVTGPMGVVFYAGAPLVIRDGSAVGTLCVVDSRPRELTPQQMEGLKALARQASQLLELRVAKHTAEEMAANRSRFLAAMSHEIRTPLNGVLGMAELLRGTRLDDEQGELVAMMAQSGEHLLRVVDDILDLDRLEAGRIELASEPVDVAILLASARAMLEPRARAKGLEVLTTVEAAAPARVLGDETRLRQILLNLGGNAIKFTDKGRVTLRAARGADGALDLLVEDTGPGIPDATLRGLFEPYRQGGAATHRAHGGSGLGLAISRHLALAMGGTLEASSSLGNGSVFRASLPLADAPAPRPSLPADEAAKRTPAGLRILVVDDDAVNQRVAVGLLRRLGCDPLVASDGESALRACADERFDLILMDVQMPGIGGLEAARRLVRSTLPGDRPLLVACTAHALAEERAAIEAAGMQRVLTKPLRVDALQRLLAEARPRSR